MRSAYLDGLPSERIDRSSRPDLEFIVDHMSQSLIVDHADVDVRSELFTCDTRVHRFVAVIVVPSRKKLITNSGIP